MAKSVVFDNDFITVWCDQENGIVSHEMHKPTSGQVLHDALEAGLEAFCRVGATKWLSDDRMSGVLPEEDFEWGTGGWEDRVIAAGWKYWAMVPPASCREQMCSQRLIDIYASAGVVARAFSDPQMAEQWLIECALD